MRDLRQTPWPSEHPRVWVFGSGQWKKALTDEELRIVYRYRSSCCSKSASNQDRGMIHFHHAASAKWTGEKKRKESWNRGTPQPGVLRT
jgi:hypothetical protein